METKISVQNPFDINEYIRSWPFELSELLDICSITSLVDSCNFEGLQPRIALIDTGIYENHPAFKQSTIVSKDFSGGNNPSDETGHGTHCAGLLVANSPEMQGFLPSVKLYSAKIIGMHRRNKLNTEVAISQALKWVINQKVQIILTTLGRNKPSALIRKAIKLATSKGIIVIASAGNYGGSLPLFPASMKEVICISALGKNMLPLPMCCTGEFVDAFIPGEAIPSARLDGWGEMTGSSQAAAVFCGLLARRLYFSS